ARTGPRPVACRNWSRTQAPSAPAPPGLVPCRVLSFSVQKAVSRQSVAVAAATGQDTGVSGTPGLPGEGYDGLLEEAPAAGCRGAVAEIFSGRCSDRGLGRGFRPQQL